jgi:hypothetical protein
MEKKVSERECKNFAKRLGIHWHKYADRQKCQHCYQLVWKTDTQVDGEFVYKSVKTVVEVKQSENNSNRWAFSDPEKGIRGNQVNLLNHWGEEHCMPFVFIVLAVENHRAPTNRGAFLVPWHDWKTTEKFLLSQGQKSIRLRGGRMLTAEETLAAYQLDWAKKTECHPSGWVLPLAHPFHHWIQAANKAHEIIQAAHQPIHPIDQALQKVTYGQ